MEYGIEDLQKYNEAKISCIMEANFTYWKGILLNLSFVTKNFAIMCTPSEKDTIKRNDTRILADYIHEICGSHFWIFNLHEQSYDETLLDSKVDFLPFADHCAPRLSYFQVIVQKIEERYNSDPNMVLFVHCKAGRGRSGTVFCAYALHKNLYPTVESAIAELEATRAVGCITIPSQIRFLHYYQYFSQHGAPKHQTIHIKKIEFHPAYPKELTIGIDSGIPYDSTNVSLALCNGSELIIHEDIQLNQEFTIFGYPKDVSNTESAIIVCQLHSDYLISELHEITKEGNLFCAFFAKNQLDGPHHRIKGSNFPDGFSMNLYYTISQSE